MKSFFRVALLLILTTNCKEETKSVAIKNVEKPNILFAIMDDVTWKHMGAYGCNWVNTPNFDRIAKDGILFNRAYTPNAKCGPSRSAILTGRNSWQLEEGANHWAYWPEKFKTFAEAMSNNGYHVGYTAKGWAPGVAKNEDGSRRELLVKGYNKVKTDPPTPHISNIDYAENFKQFLSEKDSLKPFFFWYGGLEPHRGYEYGSGINKGEYKLSSVKDEDVFKFWPAVDSVKTDLLDYAFEIEYFDKQLGKMIQTLEESGQLENTLIVVTADNGMPFPRVKGQEYEYSNHLPLAVMWTGGIKNPGRKVDDFISFIDFAPTFLELAEISEGKTGMQSITGKSFTNILYNTNNKDRNRDYVLIGKERHDVGRPKDEGYPIRGIVKDSFLYLRNFKTDRWPIGNPETGYLNTDGGATKTFILNTVYSKDDDFKFWYWNFFKRPAVEMYNIEKDPDCMLNLVNEEKYKEVVQQLDSILIKKLKEQGDPRIAGEGDIFDGYKYADLRGTDFYNRFVKKDSTLSWGWVSDTDFQNLTKVQRVQDSLLKHANKSHFD